MTLSPLINIMSAAVIKAGKGLMRDFGEVDQLQISRKGIANFVTKSDVRTENLLRAELEKSRPGYGFLLEEGGEVEGKNPEFRWIIDPIDGTSNFIHAIPYFCISVGLEQRSKNGAGEIVAGVIFDPIHNELFSAEKGKGALVNNRRLNVSGRDAMADAMVASGTPRMVVDAHENALPIFERIVRTGATVRYFGAMALDLANLAAGRLDACWYHMAQPWDIAAALLIVREAGGSITEMNGAPATPYSKTLVAANRALAEPMHTLCAA